MLAFVSGLWKKYISPPAPTVSTRQSNYPLTTPYQCRHCLSTELKQDTVHASNPNGNFHRPYYACVNPNCPNVMYPRTHHRIVGWVTWADNVGMDPGNPLCNPDCPRRNISRTDYAGVNSVVRGKRFWTCSSGACNYTLWDNR